MVGAITPVYCCCEEGREIVRRNKLNIYIENFADITVPGTGRGEERGIEAGRKREGRREREREGERVRERE